VSASRLTHCVQATRDCAFLFILAHVPRAPDAAR
jgi:hypothetical protein